MFIGIFLVPNTIRICKTVQETFSKNSWDYPFLGRGGAGGAGGAGWKKGRVRKEKPMLRKPLRKPTICESIMTFFKSRNYYFPIKFCRYRRHLKGRKKYSHQPVWIRTLYFLSFLLSHPAPPDQILNEINQQFIHKILDSHHLNNNY